MTKASIYDYPRYYDILFGWDRDLEASFYDSALRHHGIAPGSVVMEVGCGTAQIGLRLAHMGWRVLGFDLSRDMLRFAREQASREKLTMTFVEGDMRAMANLSSDAAISPMSTVRMLQSDGDLLDHLRSLEGCLEPGGVYVIDMYFVADGATDEGQPDIWDMERDGVVVSAGADGITVRDGDRLLELTWGEELRPYTFSGFQQLVRQAGFVVAAVFPETRRDDLSVFHVERRAADVEEGRAMVALTPLAGPHGL